MRPVRTIQRDSVSKAQQNNNKKQTQTELERETAQWLRGLSLIHRTHMVPHNCAIPVPEEANAAFWPLLPGMRVVSRVHSVHKLEK